MRCLGAALLTLSLVGLSPTAAVAVRPAATALIMDGTTFPTPSPGFLASAVDDFIVPTVGGSFTPIAVTTPEGIIGIDQSVADGVVALEQAMAAQPGGQPYVVFGFSQSSVIQTYVKIALAERKAAGLPVPDVTFVGIGVGNRPNGGIASRLAGLSIPLFDFTFNGAAPTDAGIPTVDIARQYDGLADTPQFVTNPVALANAVLGILFTHAFYGEEVSLDPGSPKYVPGTVAQVRGDTTYYWIPTQDLPLLDPLRLFGVPEGVLDIVEPFLTTLVEAGYDRSVPFGEATPLQVIPVIDPVTLTVQLVGAVLEGANNAAKLVGGAVPGYAQLAAGLDALEAASADVIGRPYRQVVNFLNAFNPIVAFSRIEGPVVNLVNAVVNATGIPKLLNDVVAGALFPLTAWAEHNVLFPQDVSAGGPIGAIARQVLRPVLPHLDAPDPAVAPDTAQADPEPADPEPAEQDEPAQHRRSTVVDDDDDEEVAEETAQPEVPVDEVPAADDEGPVSTAPDGAVTQPDTEAPDAPSPEPSPDAEKPSAPAEAA